MQGKTKINKGWGTKTMEERDAFCQRLVLKRKRAWITCEICGTRKFTYATAKACGRYCSVKLTRKRQKAERLAA